MRYAFNGGRGENRSSKHKCHTMGSKRAFAAGDSVIRKPEEKERTYNGNEKMQSTELTPAPTEQEETRDEPTPARAEQKEARDESTPARAEQKEARDEPTPARAEKKEARDKPTPARAEQKEARDEPTPAIARRPRRLNSLGRRIVTICDHMAAANHMSTIHDKGARPNDEEAWLRAVLRDVNRYKVRHTSNAIVADAADFVEKEIMRNLNDCIFANKGQGAGQSSSTGYVKRRHHTWSSARSTVELINESLAEVIEDRRRYNFISRSSSCNNDCLSSCNGLCNERSNHSTRRTYNVGRNDVTYNDLTNFVSSDRKKAIRDRGSLIGGRVEVGKLRASSCTSMKPMVECSLSNCVRQKVYDNDTDNGLGSISFEKESTHFLNSYLESQYGCNYENEVTGCGIRTTNNDPINGSSELEDQYLPSKDECRTFHCYKDSAEESNWPSDQVPLVRIGANVDTEALSSGLEMDDGEDDGEFSSYEIKMNSSSGLYSCKLITFRKNANQ